MSHSRSSSPVAGGPAAASGPGLMSKALASPASAPPLSSPPRSSEQGDSDSASSRDSGCTPSATPTPEPTSAHPAAAAINISVASAHLLSPPTGGHKKASSSIQIPPSRAHKLAQQAAAAAATPAASSSTKAKSSSSSVRRNKLHGASRKLEQDYHILRDCMLGSGASGQVFVCTSRRNPTHEYAVKLIKKEDVALDESKFAEEMAILATIRHRNIIRLRDVYETPNEIAIVTELAYGGELFDRILKVRSFSEKEVAKIAFKLFHAIAYLHSRGIVHRDLKPENILMSTQEANSDIKISDFGFARNLLTKPRNLRAKTQLGSFGYMAPEIFSGKNYDEKCDTWSLGIVIYICLCGLPPFVSAADAENSQPFWVYTNAMITQAKRAVEFPDSQGWQHISAQAKHFLAAALELEPAKRMRSIDALNHPWLKKKAGQHSSNISGTMAPSSSSGSSSASSSHASSAAGSSSGSAAPSAPNIHQAHEHLHRYLNFTLGKKFDLNAAKINADAEDAEAASASAAADAEGRGNSDSIGSRASPLSTPLRPSPNSQLQHSLTPTPLPTHGRGPSGVLGSTLVRSSSHDFSNLLPPPSQPCSASPSVSRLDSTTATTAQNSAFTSPVGNATMGLPTPLRTTHFADSAPSSTQFTRNNSSFSTLSAMQHALPAISPMSPVPMHPLAAADESKLDETKVGSANVSYSFSYDLPPSAAAAASALADAAPSASHDRAASTASSLSSASTAFAPDFEDRSRGSSILHSRDSSSGRLSPSASASVPSHSRKLRQPQLRHYDTLPVQYSGELNEDDEAEQEDEHSSEDEKDDEAASNDAKPQDAEAK